MASYKMTPLDIYSFHCKYAESFYKHYMSELTQTSKYIEPEDLQDRHHQATLVALRTISEVQALTKELTQKVKIHLETAFRTYQKINEEKLANAPAIAIDFGFSNSRVAVYRKNEVVVIQNSDGQKETPSYVAIDADFETSPDIYVGESAKKNSVEHPSNSISGMKEMLTKKWMDINKLHKLPFQVVIDRDIVNVRVGRFYSVEELIRTIIEKLKTNAEEYLGIRISCAVISVPVRFNARQRDILKQSCTMAGLNILQIVNEPTASLIGYDLLGPSQEVNEGTKYYLVFDLSSRKLNVTVFKYKDSKLCIVGFHEEFKGGDNFDKQMVKYCLKEFQREHGIKISSKSDSAKDGKRLRRLQMECERQKRCLSVTTNVTVCISSFYKAIDLVVPFNRDLFEKLNRDNFMELMEKVDDVIVKSDLKKHHIDQVVLAGGSSSIPGVQQKLRRYFGRDIILKEILPEEAVVHGLAMLAKGIRTNPEMVNVEIQEMEDSPSRSRIGSDVLFDPSTQTVIKEYLKNHHTEPPDFKPSR